MTTLWLTGLFIVIWGTFASLVLMFLKGANPTRGENE